MIQVNNVAPSVTLATLAAVDEGTELTIVDLALVSDPGFDDLLGGTFETFMVAITWGDGRVDNEVADAPDH